MKPVKDPATGTYKVRWRTRQGNKEVRHKRTFKRWKDAQKFIENLQAERRKDHDAAARTFDDYAEQYLAAARTRCKSRTVTGYTQDLKHARDFLGSRAVGTLRASDADAYLVHLTTTLDGAKTRSIKSAWRTFAATLELAVRDEALPSNPAHKVDLPTANAKGEPRFQPAFLTPTAVEAIANQLPEPYGLLIRFAAYSGLRRGEIAGLDIRHVTLATTPTGTWRGTVHVERTARFLSGSWTFDTPKTANSTRVVPLPGWLAEELHGYLQEHPYSAEPEAPLFPGRKRGGKHDGKHHGAITYAARWEPESFVRNIFQPAVKRANAGHVRFHDLRHTFASLCAHSGIPVERVSAWMGHASIVITWTTYTHLFRGEDDHAAIEQLGKPSTPKTGTGTDNVVPFRT